MPFREELHFFYLYLRDHLEGRWGSTRSAPQAATGDTVIESESYASREDVRRAKKFLASLPEACSGSHASASRDGTVTVQLSCEGNNKSMSGSIKIKDGVVTEIQ